MGALGCWGVGVGGWRLCERHRGTRSQSQSAAACDDAAAAAAAVGLWADEGGPRGGTITLSLG